MRRLAVATAPDPTAPPLWLETAVRLGTRFVRIAAAGTPPAAAPFAPHTNRHGCCRHCGFEHPAGVDEYYFWLADTRWYDKLEGDHPDQPDSQDADTPGWHDAGQLPTLLAMPNQPMVHLMWARIHNNEIETPRRSADGVRVPDTGAELEFSGRVGDSLQFAVTGGVAPPGYNPPPAPGFRYDLATDSAVVVPLLAAPPLPPPGPGGLVAYPFFAYAAPGAPLFPLTPFSEATSVAAVLRAHCRWEAALGWYALAFDPRHQDLSWEPPPAERITATFAGDPASPALDTTQGSARATSAESAPTPPADIATQQRASAADPPVPDDVARHRAVTLAYLDTLLDWADCLTLHQAPETTAQARLIIDSAAALLGPTPRRVDAHDAAAPGTTPATIGTLVPAAPPLSPRLMALYERVDDRRASIHTCTNAYRLHDGRPGRDVNYFGDDPTRDGWRATRQLCDDDCECCCPPSPYRFTVMVEKANQLAAATRELGAALLAAYEKGDAEYLAYLRAEHEDQLLQLDLEIKQNQLRESDWQVQALQLTKEITQTNLTYTQALINGGLISGETDYQAFTSDDIGGRTAATILEGIGEFMNFIPDVHVGTVDYVDLPIGSKLSRVFESGARLGNSIAEILGTSAGLNLTQAGWVRRDVEWRHQVEDLTLELEQIERQILAAERRRAMSLRELNHHQRQIEQSRETFDVLRDKFTGHQLYLFLQQETAALHYRMYELALCCARQAERGFNYERGHTTRRFLPTEGWDTLREGLLAGERLQLAMRRMDKAYYDENTREYELTKHISLRTVVGHSFLELKLTGRCVVELPEWLFDLDYPGHYLRRIKNMSITLPCVVGPYTGVNCRLTLLSTQTRIDPRLAEPASPCCDHTPTPGPARPPAPCACWPPARPTRTERNHHDGYGHHDGHGYHAGPGDPRIVRRYAGTEAIATSAGQRDPGLFEMTFRDERYLPFEFAGAVSRWRIELPPENNFFDLDTLSDVVLHLNYTAREGGERLRDAANAAAQAHLPDSGRRVFDMRHDLADTWNALTATRREPHHREACREDRRRADQRVGLYLGRDMFPFAPGHRDLSITRLELFLDAADAAPSEHRGAQFTVAHRPGCEHASTDEHELSCVAGGGWPGLFHGTVDVSIGPLHDPERRLIGTFELDDRLKDLRAGYLVVHYQLGPRNTRW